MVEVKQNTYNLVLNSECGYTSRSFLFYIVLEQFLQKKHVIGMCLENVRQSGFSRFKFKFLFQISVRDNTNVFVCISGKVMYNLHLQCELREMVKNSSMSRSLYILHWYMYISRSCSTD